MNPKINEEKSVQRIGYLKLATVGLNGGRGGFVPIGQKSIQTRSKSHFGPKINRFNESVRDSLKKFG